MQKRLCLAIAAAVMLGGSNIVAAAKPVAKPTLTYRLVCDNKAPPAHWGLKSYKACRMVKVKAEKT